MGPIVGRAAIAAGSGIAGGLIASGFIADFASLPLLLVGLSLGPGFAAIAGVFGVACAFATGGIHIAGIFGGMHALPSWILVRHSLARERRPDGQERWRPVGSVLCWLAVLGAAAIIANALTAEATGFGDAARSYFDAVLAALLPGATDAQRAPMVDLVAPLAPGLFVSSWLTVIVVSAVISQILLTRWSRNLRPTPKWSGLMVPDWMSWLLVVAAAMVLVSDGTMEATARSVALVFGVPYFFLGLATIHVLARRTAVKGVILATFYGMFVLFMPVVSIVAGAIGLAEHWLGLRRRFAGPAADWEDE